MKKDDLLHRETLLIETLLSGLDALGTARETGSSMLAYLTDLLVTRAKEELEEVRGAIEQLDDTVSHRTSI